MIYPSVGSNRSTLIDWRVAAVVADEFLRDRRMVMVTMISEGSLESHSVKHSAIADRGAGGKRLARPGR